MFTICNKCTAAVAQKRARLLWNQSDKPNVLLSPATTNKIVS
jgi:hypothetical protein